MEKAKKLQTEIKNIFGDAPVNLVGGSVRDIILGREPKDWDYCTSLTPDEIEKNIQDAGRKAYSIGKRFGTIGFKLPILDDSGNVEYVYVEVTTYRTDKYDGKSRKPEVDFTDDLMLDLSRRDFTINSIVLKDDEYFDPHGGRLDILAKKIKAVGMGKDRIIEDPLRMLRAARFASQLGFEVDPNFIGVMRQHASEITRVSKERWIAELDKLLMGKSPLSGIAILVNTDVMKYMIPEVWLAWQDAWVEGDFEFGISDGDTLDDRWNKLFNNIGYPFTETESKGQLKYPKHEVVRKELLIGICERLKFSNDRTKHLLK